MRLLGHVVRDGKLKNECVTGKIEGRRGNDRPRFQYMVTSVRSVGGDLRPVGSCGWPTLERSGGAWGTKLPGIRHLGKKKSLRVCVLSWLEQVILTNYM